MSKQSFPKTQSVRQEKPVNRSISKAGETSLTDKPGKLLSQVKLLSLVKWVRQVQRVKLIKELMAMHRALKDYLQIQHRFMHF